MRLILIADIHLSSSPAESFGVDTMGNFERVLSRVSASKPDHIVMMGDYSLKAPKRQDIERVHQRLKELGIDFSFISGNHDKSKDVAEIGCPNTALIDGELFYQKKLGGTTALFLDTTKGYIKSGQKAWLKNELSKIDSPALVFMHHPPIAMGVPFMDDNHSFQDEGGRVKDLLFGGDKPVYVFSGHYHTARSAQVGMHSVHLCPSTYFQLDPTLAEFGVSHAMPGIRHIELLEGQVRTWIEFLPKHD